MNRSREATMAPNNHHIASQLRHLVYYNLDCNLPRNALFFASRLHGYEPRSSEAGYLISLCYLRLEQYKSAYDYSKNSGSRGTHLGCSYVFAQSCLALARYPEGIAALERSRGLWSARNNWNKHTELRRQHLPDAAAVYCLQGKLYHAFQELNKAIEAYAEALKLNPFMWDAFLALSDLGATIRVQNIFKFTPEMMSVLSSGTAEETPLGALWVDAVPQSNTNTNSTQPNGNDPFSVSTNRLNDNRLNLSKTALFEKPNVTSVFVTPVGGQNGGYDTMETPTAPTAPTANFVSHVPRVKETNISVADNSAPNEPPHAPHRKMRNLGGVDYGTEAPPRMKTSSLRAKSRAQGEVEEADASSNAVASTITDRKRTASGRVADTSHVNGISDPSAPQRRSARLFSQFGKPNNKFASAVSAATAKEGREIKKVKSTTSGKVRSTQSTVGRVVSGNRKHLPEHTDPDAKEQRQPPATATLPLPTQQKSSNEKAKEHEALQTLLELFTKLGSGYFALSNYRCQEALNIFNSIALSQRDTPWVLAQIGRAHHEQASYVEAEKQFARIRTIAPSRMDDMELYSVVLWQLKRDIDLAHLAHELTSLDRLSPQAWIAVGNSFSLNREHDQALKCFKRATQLDPTFAYAFTLQGHEHVANEEYDKAMAAYRNGIIADRRHYNAWWGMGRVYERQGKYDVAQKHFETAFNINPTNAVLLCSIGTMLEKQRQHKQALEKYMQSVELAPHAMLARYKQARILTSMARYDEALLVLKRLKDLVPNESNVHFLLGKVYKLNRNRQEAVRHFTIANTLDPKASQHIKEAMEQMEQEEEDSDGAM